MTTTSAVLRAVATHLAGTGFGLDPFGEGRFGGGVADYRPDGSAYPPGMFSVITIKTVPTAPDRVLTLAVYDIEDSPDPTDDLRTFALQVRTRGLAQPTTDVDDLAESARDVLTVHHATWGEVHVDRCYRTTTIPLGADGNRRQERTDNYRLTTRR